MENVTFRWKFLSVFEFSYIKNLFLFFIRKIIPLFFEISTKCLSLECLVYKCSINDFGIHLVSIWYPSGIHLSKNVPTPFSISPYMSYNLVLYTLISVSVNISY